MEYPTRIRAIRFSDLADDDETAEYYRDVLEVRGFFERRTIKVFPVDFYSRIVEAYGPDATAEGLAASILRTATVES